MLMKRAFVLGVLMLASAGLPASAAAAQVQVAVAANFTEPAKAIAFAFKKRTGHEAVLSFGSSGQFYAQIGNGAPFGVLLSADTERAAKAEQEGLGVKGSAFVYATGRLVLYSRTAGLVDGQGAVLRQPARFANLAIADPRLAPYGQAAVQTMTKLGVYAGLQGKIVQGTSITQAFQFTQTGAADLGFVALSQVIDRKGGSRWLVPAKFHSPIDQGAVLLTPAANNPAAKSFMTFLKGPEAKAIIRRYGYTTR